MKEVNVKCIVDLQLTISEMKTSYSKPCERNPH